MPLCFASLYLKCIKITINKIKILEKRFKTRNQKLISNVIFLFELYEFISYLKFKFQIIIYSKFLILENPNLKILLANLFTELFKK